MASSDTQQDVDNFIAITQATPDEANRFLTPGVDLQSALETYYAAQAASETGESDALLTEETASHTSGVMSDPADRIPPAAGGPRTLDGRPAEGLPENWGQQAPAKKSAAPSGGIATLFNTGLHAGLGGSRSGPSGSDDDDDEDPQEYFAGGEKSGLAVQDPNHNRGNPRGIVSNILAQAAKNSAAEPRDTPARSSFFGGSGNVLGSEDAPTQTAAESQPSGSSSQPSSALPAQAPGAGGSSSSALNSLMGAMFGGRGAAAPQEEEDEDDQEVQMRHLTFWRNGFSIEDGPLLSYDDAENKKLLEAIHAGRAPPSVFGVRYNQPLQVVVAQKTNEDYVKPKTVTRAFGGEGNRLGSPAPEIVGGTSTTPMPGGFGNSNPAGSSTSSPRPTSTFEVDESQPTTSIQLRLGDGTKMVAKVNLSHTVGDLRNFVSAARPDNRRFVLQTTFPSKELGDEAETVEAAKLQNAVVVQRFI